MHHHGPRTPPDPEVFQLCSGIVTFIVPFVFAWFLRRLLHCCWRWCPWARSEKATAFPISTRSISRATFRKRAGRWCCWTSGHPRSEEHTSELQSHVNLVCRLLLEKKKYKR